MMYLFFVMIRNGYVGQFNSIPGQKLPPWSPQPPCQWVSLGQEKLREDVNKLK